MKFCSFHLCYIRQFHVALTLVVVFMVVFIPSLQIDNFVSLNSYCLLHTLNARMSMASIFGLEYQERNFRSYMGTPSWKLALPVGLSKTCSLYQSIILFLGPQPVCFF